MNVNYRLVNMLVEGIKLQMGRNYRTSREKSVS
jgi:hypothetical protein